jgi:hypothetical protein
VQGEPGTTNPLGDDIPIHFSCGVSHVPLAGDAALTAAGAAAFLARGENLTAPTSACSNGGYVLEVTDITLVPGRRSARVAPPPSASVDALESSGALDALRMPEETVIVTDDVHPVSFTLPPGTRAAVRRVDGTTQGDEQTFTAGPEGLAVETGSGGALTVTPLDTPPPPPPGPGPSGGVVPVTPGPADSGGGGTPGAATPRIRSATLSRAGRLVVRLACPAGGGACNGAVRLTGKPGGRRAGRKVLARGSYGMPAGAKRTLKLRLSGAARGALRRRGRLAVVLEVRTAGKVAAKRALTLRRRR